MEVIIYIKNIVYINIRILNFHYFIVIFLFLSQLKLTYGESCKAGNSINNNECFNNIVIFNDKNYRAGSFAKNKNGDIIIEYSAYNSRLFYGLKNDGKYFFNDESPIKVIENINNDDGLTYRYESENIFVSLEDDTNKDNQYLLSISTFQTLAELHNFQTNNYVVRKTENFIGNEIYAYQFSLLETQIDNQNIYFCIYIHLNGTEGNITTIKKFGFTEFSLTSYHDIQSLQLNTNCNNRILSCFIIEEEKIIVIFFVKTKERLAVSFYDFNLNNKGQNQELNNLNHTNLGTGIFFKSIYLKNRIFALVFYENGDKGNSLLLRTYNIIIKDDGNYNKQLKLNKNINKYNFQTNITLNDFIKINNERLVFISTVEFTTLYILIFDLYNNYTNVKIRVYKYQLANYRVVKELSAYLYNNYLIFSSTVELISSSGSSYANETENTIIIDISPYFNDIDNYDSNNNIITKLSEKLIIDNNIFGYIPANQIKLISIPNQIIFYNGHGDETSSLSNGDILEFEHIINQKKDLIKNNDYYSFEFQFIIEEPDYETLFNNAHDLINDNSDIDKFEQKKFYGKTNTVKFKLCHEYCASCKKLGRSDDDQQCMSCLEIYQYDYFNEYPSNCVPFSYFNDKEENKLVKCNKTNSKYYIDLTNNKTICFKIIYDCPFEYQYLNFSSNECIKYIPPSTILTTIPINTNPSTIITTFQTTIISFIPSKITTIPNSISNNIPYTFINGICSYNKLLNNECSFENNNNTEIYNKIKNEIIKTYPLNGESVVIKAEDNYIFQVTTEENEINTFNGKYENAYNLSMIDLDECQMLLKSKNSIHETDNLIIFEFEKITNISSEKNVQYEVFDPNTLEQLDLSICKDSSINIYIPISLSQEKENLYNDLKESGYDLFDENDSFYTDICTPYKSENGTDVLLSDRKKDFYNNSEVSCQANCNYSEYLSELKYLKCECYASSEDIDTSEPEILCGEMIVNSFYDVLKYSNFKVVKCYKLIFNLEILKKNFGSIIVIVFFLLYLLFVIVYIFKGISPLKINISNLIRKKEQIGKTNQISRKKINENISKENFDRNKRNSSFKIIKRNDKKRSNSLRLKKKCKSIKIESNKLNKKHKTFIFKKISSPSKKKKNTTKNPPIIQNVFLKINNNLNIRRKYSSKNDNLDSKSLIIHKNNILDNKNNFLKTKRNEIINKKITKEEFSNFELNELEYFQAIKLDKRPFHQIYWSLLKREHRILFTFLSPNDYNLLYVKLARFFFLICQDMAMNVVFFSDDSMHKLYANYGKYNFIQQIPQIIYSISISQIIEVLLCYLSLTDKHFYQIKKMINKKMNKTIIFKNLKFIKIKLFIFFVFTFILFLIYWYFITAFCAVYQNTQISFIKDSISSFLTGLLYPFIFYLFPPILRIISLKDAAKKRLNCLYKLSDIIPIF